MSRYVFKFLYEKDFMVLCYEDGINKKYFNSAEHYLGDAEEYADLFLENGGNEYVYIVPNFATLNELDVFALSDEKLKELEQYFFDKQTEKKGEQAYD